MENYYQEGDKMVGLDRYEILDTLLSSTSGVVQDEREAMTYLKKASNARFYDNQANDFTVHSVVYNLKDKKVFLVPYQEYDKEASLIEYQLQD